MRRDQFFVYILTNQAKRVLYTGVTNDLRIRLDEHRAPKGDQHCFTGKYYCYYLVYYKSFGNPSDAIAREKQIKSWNRTKKIRLIEAFNPAWRFLNDEIG